MNSDDLKAKLKNAECLHRSAIINGAVVRSCKEGSINFERPRFEERSRQKNKTTPHWLRREIGQVMISNVTRGGWAMERVHCYSCSDMLSVAKSQL